MAVSVELGMTTSRGGGETPNIKGVGMLFVSRRGINFVVWSHLGCSGQNAIAVEVSFSTRKIYIVCVLTGSLRGQKKLGPRPDRSPLGVYFKIFNEHPQPFHMRGPSLIWSNTCLIFWLHNSLFILDFISL